MRYYFMTFFLKEENVCSQYPISDKKLIRDINEEILQISNNFVFNIFRAMDMLLYPTAQRHDRCTRTGPLSYLADFYCIQ